MCAPHPRLVNASPVNGGLPAGGGAGFLLDPLVPVPLVVFLALVLGAFTVWVYQRTSSRLGALRRGVLLGFRLTGLALVLLILLQPSRQEPLPAERRDQVTLVAVDASRSMRQTDSGQRSRLDTARELLWEAGAVPRGTEPPPGGIRLFRFGTDAAPLTTSLAALEAADRTTKFHQSIQTILGSLSDTEGAPALFLLTDGHDFELANPAQTALLARNRQVPIYAVGLGGEGKVRDLSIRMTSYEPFHYARQAIRLGATVRVLGCPYETLKIALLREGRPVQSRTLTVREEVQVPVTFEVAEPAAGQFEYRMEIEPLAGEVDATNNRASIYCNVIEKKIRILVLEGEPYWDTTFLLRSLRRNEKLEVDSAVSYGPSRLSVIRTAESREPFHLPAEAAEWNHYDLVILGRAVDRQLDAPRIAGLERWVEKSGGALVFARADAFSGKQTTSLQPVAWGRLAPRPGPVQVGREGQHIAPLRFLAGGDPELGRLPPPLGVYESSDRQPLTATLAVTETIGAFPAMVHRRVGAGQVLAIGVDGLWRWAFNARSEGQTTVYDRFWDQMVLWLMSGRDFMPDTRFTFRADTGSVQLGEKIRFRVVPRDPEALPAPVPVLVRHEGREVARLNCTPVPGTSRLGAEFVPEQPGRYEAIADLPDATRSVVRFAAWADDAEETEVAADPAYLRRLCEATRGRLIRPEEFAGLLASVKSAPVEDSPRLRKVPLWDEAWLFWLLGGLFGTDWFLRRRWGLC